MTIKLRSEDLVALVGGPMDGRWYYADDWRDLVVATVTMGPYERHDPVVLGYKPTSGTVPHPVEPGDVPPAADWRWTR